MAEKDDSLGSLCTRKGGGSLAYCHESGVSPGALIFKMPFASLMTEWVFDDYSVGYTKAYINGVCVCDGHSTTHIIDYDVVSKSQKAPVPGGTSYTFTMSIEFSSGVLPCVFRCWEKSAKKWEDAAPEHRAELHGSSATVATFELVMKYDGTWTLTAI